VEKNKQQMLENKGKYAELKSRLIFVLGALLVYRMGTFMPVPGIDPAALAVMFEQQKGIPGTRAQHATRNTQLKEYYIITTNKNERQYSDSCD